MRITDQSAAYRQTARALAPAVAEPVFSCDFASYDEVFDLPHIFIAHRGSEACLREWLARLCVTTSNHGHRLFDALRARVISCLDAHVEAGLIEACIARGWIAPVACAPMYLGSDDYGMYDHHWLSFTFAPGPQADDALAWVEGRAKLSEIRDRWAEELHNAASAGRSFKQRERQYDEEERRMRVLTAIVDIHDETGEPVSYDDMAARTGYSAPECWHICRSLRERGHIKRMHEAVKKI